MGTDQWEELSQKERQQKLLDLDTQAQEQIRMGKVFQQICKAVVQSTSSMTDTKKSPLQLDFFEEKNKSYYHDPGGVGVCIVQSG